MAEELRFNICKFPSSFLRNEDVPDIEAMKGADISPLLRYACSHWIDRASELEILDAELLEMLCGFLQNHFLHWLEVMSILGLSPVQAFSDLQIAQACYPILLSIMIQVLIDQR